MFIYMKDLLGIPLVFFALLWSAAIIGGEFFKNKKNINSFTKEIIEAHLKTINQTMLQFSCVFVSMLLLGAFGPVYLKWILLALNIIVMMVFFVRIAAATDYGYHTLKKIDSATSPSFIGIIFLDSLVLLQVVFSLYWLLKIYVSFGM